MNEQSVIVKHNVEMGHRLSLQPDSKCFHLHGHSWWIELELFGVPDSTGMIINFSDVKGPWRKYLDGQYDHHMVLNKFDPMFAAIDDFRSNDVEAFDRTCETWGLVRLEFDPTVENMAKLWAHVAWELFVVPNPNIRGLKIDVQEAAVNRATYSLFK